MLTVQEKIELVKLYYQGNSARRARDLWLEQHPGRPLFHHCVVLRAVATFERDGTLLDKRQTANHRRRVIPAQNVANVLALVQRGPSMSVRHMSRELNLQVSQVHKVLKKKKNTKVTIIANTNSFWRVIMREEYCSVLK